MRGHRIIQLCAWRLVADPEKWHIGKDYIGSLDDVDLIDGPEDYLYFKSEKAAEAYARENRYYDWEISSFNSSKGLRFWKKQQSINY